MDRLSSKGSMIDQIDLGKVPRSSFDRSFHNYLSGTLGKIIPTRVEEVLPGDRIKGSSHIVANFEPLVYPILGNMVLKQETFYVPQSILWKNAHNFFTGKKGFNNAIPSKSHRDIYGALSHFKKSASPLTYADFIGVRSFFESLNNKLIALNDTYSELLQAAYVNVAGFKAYRSAMAYVCDQFNPEHIVGFLNWLGTNYKVADLVQPMIYRVEQLKYNYEGGEPHNPDKDWVGDSSFTDPDQIHDYICNYLGNLLDFWFGASSLMDYMGIGKFDCLKCVKKHIIRLNDQQESQDFEDFFSNIPFNWIPMRANYSIWYWNYRDQLLEQDALDAEEFIDTDEISDIEIVLLCLSRQRCWFKDMFTTALTNTGNGNILIPSLGDAYSYAESQFVVNQTMQDLSNTSDESTAKLSGSDVVSFTIGGIDYRVPSNYLMHNSDIQGDAQSISSDYYISLDMIDRAKRLSKWLSKRLILGVEYEDVLYSSFMVKLSNVRMRIPELLDAGRSTVAINTVVNNTTIPDAQVAGDKSAVAWAENTSDGVNYYAEEHGYLISYMTILPVQTYPYGINRMWLRQNRFDFAWPEFSQMGMDAIYNVELAHPEGEQDDNAPLAVFGYQGRYYDYKSKLDEEHGRLHTDLSYLTFARPFDYSHGGESPKLNYIFVHCWPSLDMFVTDDPNFDVIRSIDVSHNYSWERALPVPSETV